MNKYTGSDPLTVWKTVLGDIKSQGKEYIDRRSRVCTEMLHTVITIKNVNQSILGPINYLSSLKRWIYPSLQDIKQALFLSKTDVSYEYSFAQRLLSYRHTVDQLDGYVIPSLQKNPFTRQAVITIADPQTDCTISQGNIPAVLSVDFKIREKKLHILVTIRSCDVFIGLPANLYQMYLLQEYVAQKLYVSLGDMTVVCASAHIFSEYKKEITDLLHQ